MLDTLFRIVLHDSYGRLLDVLKEGKVIKGAHNIHFDGKNNSGQFLENGIYFITFECEEYRRQIKMIILR